MGRAPPAASGWSLYHSTIWYWGPRAARASKFSRKFSNSYFSQENKTNLHVPTIDLRKCFFFSCWVGQHWQNQIKDTCWCRSAERHPRMVCNTQEDLCSHQYPVYCPVVIHTMSHSLHLLICPSPLPDPKPPVEERCLHLAQWPGTHQVLQNYLLNNWDSTKHTSWGPTPSQCQEQTAKGFMC